MREAVARLSATPLLCMKAKLVSIRPTSTNSMPIDRCMPDQCTTTLPSLVVASLVKNCKLLYCSSAIVQVIPSSLIKTTSLCSGSIPSVMFLICPSHHRCEPPRTCCRGGPSALTSRPRTSWCLIPSSSPGWKRRCPSCLVEKPQINKHSAVQPWVGIANIPKGVATPGKCVVVPPWAAYLSATFLTPGVSKTFL